MSSISDMSTMGDLFDEALQALQHATEDPAAASVVDRIINDQLPGLLRPLTTSAAFDVRGSTGIGTRADVPWVGVFPAGDTSAKTGLYLVYLFAADGSRVYLSLIQGTEIVRRLTVLQKRAIDLRRVTSQPEGTTTEIALGSVLTRPRRYEAATAYAYEYRMGEMPSDHVMTVQLQQMITAYSEAANLALGAIEPTHLLVKWNPAKGSQALTAHKTVAAEHGATWWGVMSQRPRVLSDNNVALLQTQIDEGVSTHVYLYGGDQVWRTDLIGITESPDEIDETLRPSYYSTSGCRLFLKLATFQQLPPTWPLMNLVLANSPSNDPDVLARGLGNQTSPMFVYELAGAGETVTTAEAVAVAPETELTLEWLRKRTLLDDTLLDELVTAAGASSTQIVLVGPPGTSKTWVARALARYLTQDRPFAHRIVQFHATYGYEEFIEGLRPVAKDGAIVFDRVDGVVLQMVDEMDDDEDMRVLVIDEMNRANLPRVFGELMYLFEYRDEPIDLLYTKSFKLPAGMRFIGTMNSADRSIRSLDTALRRRFDVFELPPSRDVLERFYADDDNENQIPTLFEGFDALNERLTSLIDRHHTIGHSFFMADEMTWTRLREVWTRKIGPLIEEYFFDQPDLAQQFTLDGFFGEP